LAFKPGEEVDDFALRLSSLKQRLEQYGNYEITEERAITKFLRCSPKKHLQLKIAIQTMIDISTLTIEELTGRFKAVDDEMAGESFPSGDKLYYATEHYQCHELPGLPKEGGASKRTQVWESHAGHPRHVVALRAMHEEVPRRPPLRRMTTTMATTATTVAGLATLIGSATSRGEVGPVSSQGAARPTSRRSWKKTRRWLCSRNTTPESRSRINVFCCSMGLPKCT
jgi:hypothetical protein